MPLSMFLLTDVMKITKNKMFATATIDVHLLTSNTDLDKLRQHFISRSAVGHKQKNALCGPNLNCVSVIKQMLNDTNDTNVRDK